MFCAILACIYGFSNENVAVPDPLLYAELSQVVDILQLRRLSLFALLVERLASREIERITTSIRMLLDFLERSPVSTVRNALISSITSLLNAQINTERSTAFVPALVRSTTPLAILRANLRHSVSLLVVRFVNLLRYVGILLSAYSDSRSFFSTPVSDDFRRFLADNLPIRFIKDLTMLVERNSMKQVNNLEDFIQGLLADFRIWVEVFRPIVIMIHTYMRRFR